MEACLLQKLFKNDISVVEINKYGIIWLKLNQSLLKFNEDLYICNTDIPPPSSKVLIDKDFDLFEEIEKSFEKKNKIGRKNAYYG